MSHHKRGKPKSARGGCLMCKPHKHQGTGRTKRIKHTIAKRLVELQE